MSQIVYTELEGFPLRWEYKGAVPQETKKEADRTAKTWSVSTTPAAQVSNTNADTVNAVHGPNMVAQMFKTPANATKATAIQIYGNRVGSPPNPLYVEVRKPLRRLENSVYNTGGSFSATAGTEYEIAYVETVFKTSGRRAIIVSIGLGGPTGTAYIKKGSATLSSVTVLNDTMKRTNTFIAEDDSGDLSAVYRVTFIPNTSTTVFFHVNVMVVPNAEIVINSAGTSIPAGSTQTIASLTSTNMENRVVLASISVGPAVAAGNIRLKKDTTVVNSNDFALEGCWVLLYPDSGEAATYSVEIYNNTTSATTGYAWMVVFTVESSWFVNGGVVSIPGTTWTAIASLNTSGASSKQLAVIGVTDRQSQSGMDTGVRMRIGSTEIWTISGVHRPGIFFSSDVTTAGNNVLNLECYSSSATSAAGQILAFIPAYDPPAVSCTVGETVLLSGNIPAANVGTTAAWINIPITAGVLRPNEYYAIVVYTVGGDASNYYAIRNGGSGGPAMYEYFMSSSNAGSSWTVKTNTDLSFQLIGVQYAQIYSGMMSDNVKHSLGGVVIQLSVMAQTSSSMELAAFDDYTLTSPVITSTASSQTEIIILSPTDPRTRDVYGESRASWSIWAAGLGLSTRAYTQRHVYMTKNPIYPADFGFSELYLVMDELPPKAHVALNDNVVAGLFNSSETQTRIDSYELFRIPVRKADVIAEP
ncbi:MAG: hypothetical protein QXU44_12850, partial [Candidatus Caldarchaeum sp.]